MESVAECLGKDKVNYGRVQAEVALDLAKDLVVYLKSPVRQLSLIKEEEPIAQVMKAFDKGYDPDRAARLDPKFADVHALFFWPERLSQEKGERNPNVNMPTGKVIIKDKDAFLWGNYADDLFTSGKIDYYNVNGDYENEEEQLIYLRKRGFILHRKTFSMKDALGDVGLESTSQ